MHVHDISLDQSPRDPSMIRLSASVTYRDKYPVEHYWFDTSRVLADSVSESGHIWTLALLPLAILLREELVVEAAIDSIFYTNIQRLMAIWGGWYPYVKPVALHTDVIDKPQDTIGRVGAFYSGGVDSMYTVIQDDDHTINDLITVWGLDIDIADERGFSKLSYQANQLASKLNKNLVIVSTNLRTTRWHSVDWTNMGFGLSLGACGLLLERLYERLLISSTGVVNIGPHGSHPQTDPLYSTGSLQFEHFGTGISRWEKLKAIAHREVTRRYLRVCWKSPIAENCGACEKCIRTMVALDLLGALEKSQVFNTESYSPRQIETIYLSENAAKMFTELKEEAAQLGRADIVSSIDQSLRRSSVMKRWLRREDVHRLTMSLRRRERLWRWLKPVRRLLKRRTG